MGGESKKEVKDINVEGLVRRNASPKTLEGRNQRKS